MDVMTPSQRRKAMSSNRGRTAPERALASRLWRNGLRYFTDAGYKSRRGKSLTGRPDIIFPKKRLAIFVDGCFWHGCRKCDKNPGQSGEFWANKIRVNANRDLRVSSELRGQGWTVIRVPEHDLRTKDALARTVDWLTSVIKGGVSEAAEVGRGEDDA